MTLLKPLYGDEPLLEEALASFCRQTYPDYQIVFGLQDPRDPALLVLRRLQRRFPERDIAVVIDSRPHGTNRKVSNLINMLPAARHDLLVISDSDMHVAPDFLARIAEAVAEPHTGVVTTIYSGRPASAGLAGRCGAAYINHSFMPGALMARRLGRQDCLGATMALTRQTLVQIGGLTALVDHLADDAMLGWLVREQGLSTRLARTIPATTVPETRLGELFAHELRWARTIRRLAPLGYFLSLVQFPVFWAALAWLTDPSSAGFAAFFAAIWLCRWLLTRQVDARLDSGTATPFWLVPLRDLLSAAVMLASYTGRRVAWRGQILQASGPPMLHPARNTLAPGEG